MTAGNDQIFRSVAEVLGGTLESLGQYVLRIGGHYDEDDSYSELADGSTGIHRINKRRGHLMDLQTKIYGEDECDNAMAVIDFAHREIHEGAYFSATSYLTTNSSGVGYYWSITAPDTTKRIHFTAELTCGGSGGRVELIADPEVTATGVRMPAWNNNRNSPNIAASYCEYGVTVTGQTGKMLKNWYIGSSSGPFRSGGGAGLRIEHVLKQAKVYVVKFTPAADNTPIAVNMEWYGLDGE